MKTETCKIVHFSYPLLRVIKFIIYFIELLCFVYRLIFKLINILWYYEYKNDINSESRSKYVAILVKL